MNLQSWLLCVEMLPAAIFMLFAFPWLVGSLWLVLCGAVLFVCAWVSAMRRHAVTVGPGSALAVWVWASWPAAGCSCLQVGVHAAGQLVSIYPPGVLARIGLSFRPQVGVCGGGRQHPRRQHHACHLNQVGACRRLCLGLTVAAQCCGGACSAEPGRLAHLDTRRGSEHLAPHLPTICRDVVTDTVHQFAPAYHDYVLYSDGTRKAVTPPKTVRTRTFVAGRSGWDGCGPSQCWCQSPLSLGCRLCVEFLTARPVPSPCSAAVGQESSQQHTHGDQLLMNMELGERYWGLICWMCSLCSVTHLVPRHQPVAAGE